MGVEELMLVFADVALPALRTLQGAGEEVAGCCATMPGLAMNIVFLLIHCLICLGDAVSNTWQFIQFDLNSYFTNDDLEENGQIRHLLGQWGGYVLCFSIVPAISNFALACVMIHHRRTQYKTVSIAIDKRRHGVAEQTAILYWMIFNSVFEFLFEIIAISSIKLVIAFKSELALEELKTTPSIISGGITLLLALFDYVMLGRRTYLAYHAGSGCCLCRGLEYVLGFVSLLLFQSIGLGVTMYSFGISVGLVDVHPHNDMDFNINILIVGGLSFGAAILMFIIIIFFSCICRQRPRQSVNNDLA